MEHLVIYSEYFIEIFGDFVSMILIKFLGHDLRCTHGDLLVSIMKPYIIPPCVHPFTTNQHDDILWGYPRPTNSGVREG